MYEPSFTDRAWKIGIEADRMRGEAFDAYIAHNLKDIGPGEVHLVAARESLVTALKHVDRLMALCAAKRRKAA